MEIYDNGYLTEDDKAAMDTQNLIDLAASFHANNPVDSILPRYVYKYGFDPDGKIYRWKYICNEKRSDSTNILWDIYVHAKHGNHDEPRAIRKTYCFCAYLDDDGKEISWNGGKVHTLIPVYLAGCNDAEQYYREGEIDTIYYLEWKSDNDFLMAIKALHNKTDGAA